MQLSATEVRVLSRLLERALALAPAQREAFLEALPEPQQALVPRLRERLAQQARTEAEAEVAVAPPAPRPPRPDVRVGPYRLLQPLSGDERGRVWQVERADGGARKAFVLRLPPLPAPGAPPPSAAERQVVLLPQHPDILRLIDAGIDTEGRFYRVLPHVDGLGLVAHAQRRGLGVPGLVALMHKVCTLVAHVHEEEVACGDLGLTSLRIDDEGRVLLLDWGQGRTLRADARSADIQALGAMLQALLDGREPGAEPDAAARPPRATSPGPDLGHVLQRLRQVEGAPPYTTVAALIEDLQHMRAWRPVPGAKGGTLYLARLYVRRRRVPLALAALATVLALAGGVAGWQAWQRGQGQAQRADEVRVFLQQHLPEALPETPAPTGTPDLAIEAPRVQQALERARAGFDGQPVLRGQVITALGVRFRVLGQPDQALAVLQEAETLLQRTARPDDPALFMARAQLALQWLQLGGVTARSRADTLAQQVLQGCTSSPACDPARALAQQVVGGPR